MKSSSLMPLDPAFFREVVRRALAEDLGWGDVATELTVVPDAQAKATVTACQACVIAGLDVASEVFRQLDPAVRVTTHIADGESCPSDSLVVEFDGAAPALLTAGNTAMNFLQRLTGIATLTRRFVTASNNGPAVLDTRSTTPTLRTLEKYAVRAGGGVNNRMTLDDGILLERAHIRFAGGISQALSKALGAGKDLPVAIEVQNAADAQEAIDAGAMRLLVDVAYLPCLPDIVRQARGRAQVQVGGAVREEHFVDLAKSGADLVSVKALTQSAPAVLLRLDVLPLG